MNICDMRFFLCIGIIDSILILYIVNDFWLILMRWNLFIYINWIRFFIIDTSAWL